MTTGATTLLVRHDDLPGRAAGNLLVQWQDKARFVAFARALGVGAQDLEDDAFDLLVGTTLGNASGDALDQWGDLVGEYRQGLADGPYRGFIRARIQANRSAGKVDELIRIFQSITAPSTVVSQEFYPKHLTIRAYRPGFMEERWRNRVRAMMQAIKPAGTFLELVEVQPLFFALSPPPGYPLGVGGLSRII